MSTIAHLSLAALGMITNGANLIAHDSNDGGLEGVSRCNLCCAWVARIRTIVHAPRNLVLEKSAIAEPHPSD